MRQAGLLDGDGSRALLFATSGMQALAGRSKEAFIRRSCRSGSGTRQ